MLPIICAMPLMIAYVETDWHGNRFLGNASDAPIDWSLVPLKSYLITLLMRLYFVLLGIKAKNNFTLQIMPYKKSGHGMILILLSFQNKIFIRKEF